MLVRAAALLVSMFLAPGCGDPTEATGPMPDAAAPAQARVPAIPEGRR
jgi:hypothetical protein